MKNEKGITLIELLVTISIMLLISSILWGLLSSTSKNYTNISSNGNLEQEANLILTTIKNYHYKQSLHDNVSSNSIGTYVIKYDSTAKKGYIGKNALSLVPLQSDNINLIIQINGTIPTNNNPTLISPTDPLYLDLTVLNQNGQSYEVNTIIKQY